MTKPPVKIMNSGNLHKKLIILVVVSVVVVGLLTFYRLFFVEDATNQVDLTALGVKSKVSVTALSASPLFEFQDEIVLEQNERDFIGEATDMVALSDGKILLLDGVNKNVKVYNDRGRLLTIFGAEGKGPGELGDPYGLAIDSRGNIFVVDPGNHRVTLFDKEYNYIRSFSPKHVLAPEGIAIDWNDDVYLIGVESSKKPRLIHKYDPDGTYLGSHYEMNRRVRESRKKNTALGLVDVEADVAVDRSARRIYASHTTDYLVTVYSKDWTLLDSLKVIPSFYRDPEDVILTLDNQSISTWLNHCTLQDNGLFVFHHLLLCGYSTVPNKQELSFLYYLAVYDLRERDIVAEVKTDYKPQFVTPDGMLYLSRFRSPERLEILKYRINMKIQHHE